MPLPISSVRNICLQIPLALGVVTYGEGWKTNAFILTELFHTLVRQGGRRWNSAPTPRSPPRKGGLMWTSAPTVNTQVIPFSYVPTIICIAGGTGTPPLRPPRPKQGAGGGTPPQRGIRRHIFLNKHHN